MMLKPKPTDTIRQCPLCGSTVALWDKAGGNLRVSGHIRTGYVCDRCMKRAGQTRSDHVS